MRDPGSMGHLSRGVHQGSRIHGSVKPRDPSGIQDPSRILHLDPEKGCFAHCAYFFQLYPLRWENYFQIKLLWQFVLFLNHAEPFKLCLDPKDGSVFGSWDPGSRDPTGIQDPWANKTKRSIRDPGSMGLAN